jgi:hypothetical protein
VVELARFQDLLARLVRTSVGSQFEAKAMPRITSVARRIEDRATALRRSLVVPYPFAAPAGATVGEFAIGPRADGPVVDVALRRSADALARIVDLHRRLHAKLCIAAERVESALGLPPLPEPAAKQG